MRKYEYLKTASFLDRNLRSMNKGQKEWEDYSKKEFCPLSKLKEKMFFYWQMARMNEVLRRAIKGGHVSLKDYCLLTRLWLRVLFRIYQPR